MSRRTFTAALTAAVAVTAFAVPAQAQDAIPAGNQVVINEVESNGDSVGDWVELANTNPNETLDISGWSIVDNDPDHERIVFPEGTTIESGGYYSLYTDIDNGFGLGGNDSVSLFNQAGELVDETTWDGHAATTWGRIPDMTGEFAVTGEPTRDQKNAGAGDSEDIATEPWPFDPQEIQNLDLGEEFQVEDMSGVDFDDNGRAWIVNNGESRLFVLDYKDGEYTLAGSWDLKYADGSGLPDTEGITATGDGLYVSTERNNADKSVSHPSVLRFDYPTETSETLSATSEWNLAEFLPENLGANAGLEAIEAVPGGFAGGVEGTGEVLFVDLSGDQPQLVQSYQSPFTGVMALDYSGSQLRVMCDEACEGASIVLEKGTEWAPVTGIQARPAAMENFANEGYASFSDECTTRFLWADDAGANGTSLRAASSMDADCGVDEQQPGVFGSFRESFLVWAGAILSVIGGAALFGWIASNWR